MTTPQIDAVDDARRRGRGSTKPAEELRPPPPGSAPGTRSSDGTYERLTVAVLVAHQRRSEATCLCGWGVLGASHAEHVAAVLRASGALRDEPRDQERHRAHRAS